MRILRSVIESLVLAMLNAGHDLPLCRAVARKLVGDLTRGGRICLFSSLRNSRSAACLLRRRCTGTVNLSGRVSRMQASGSGHWDLLPTHITDFGPDLKFLGPLSYMLCGSDVIAAEVEEVIDLIVG